MKASASDPRSIRTRRLLRNAFIKLSVEKKFASLTVQDVTRAAGLNRSTFYLHYAGVHELLKDCAETLFQELREDINVNQELAFEKDPIILKPFAEIVFHHLEKYENFYKTMLGRQGDPLFQDIFQELLAELMFEPIKKVNPDFNQNSHYEMVRSFFSAGFSGLALWWLKAGKPISIEEASLIITRDLLPDYWKLMSK